MFVRQSECCTESAPERIVELVRHRTSVVALELTIVGVDGRVSELPLGYRLVRRNALRFNENRECSLLIAIL
jgi:hypothetical protein